MGVNIQKISCISDFRYINQLTKDLIRKNIVFIFFKYGLQQLMGRFISNTKFWKMQRGHAPDIKLTYITHTLEMLKTIEKIAVFVENIGFIGHLLKI